MRVVGVSSCLFVFSFSAGNDVIRLPPRFLLRLSRLTRTQPRCIRCHPTSATSIRWWLETTYTGERGSESESESESESGSMYGHVTHDVRMRVRE